MYEGSAGGRQCKRRGRAPGFDRRECFRVFDRVAAHAQRHVVATVLALDSQPAGQPPHGRMIEEQGFSDRLDQVDEVIVPLNVRELVRQDGVRLRGREIRERRHRHDDDGPEPADNGGRVDEAALGHMHSAADAEERREASDRRLPVRGRDGERRAMKLPDPEPAEYDSHGQRGNADEPEHHQQR